MGDRDYTLVTFCNNVKRKVRCNVRLISIEEVSNGWILSLALPGHEVRKICTTVASVQLCLKHWLEDPVADSISDDEPFQLE